MSATSEVANTGPSATGDGDTAWVIGAVTLIAFTDVLTRTGNAVLAILTLVAAGFAVVQFVGLRRLDRAQS